MFANRYTAIVDACSLASVWRRNLLLTLAEAEFFRVRWSEPILTETETALERIFTKRSVANAQEMAAKAIAKMKIAFPEAMIEDFDHLANAVSGLPDPNDGHVVAAALKTQAQTIVTENLKHFPSNLLLAINLEARCADDFIADTIALEEGRAIAAISRMRHRLRLPAMTPADMLRALEAHGLVETASILSRHTESL